MAELISALSDEFDKSLQFFDPREPNDDGDTIVHCSIILRSEVESLACIEMYPELLSFQNNLFQTPIHIAIILQQHRVVSALLDNDVDLNAMDYKGNTPLHTACKKGFTSMVELLLPKADASKTNTLNKDGYTYFHLAVKHNRVDIVELLLLSNIIDETGIMFGDGTSGRSAVHFAVDDENEKLLEMFLDRCKNDVNVIYHEDWSFNSPLDLARGRNNKRIQRMLENC